MAGNPQTWTGETVRIAGAELTFVKGGSGKPLLVLHEELLMLTDFVVSQGAKK